jgi:glucan phosphoethanolaminetransferase (alkaline phosphatase superfamily)
MEGDMGLLIFFLYLFAAWDAFTTFYGVLSIFTRKFDLTFVEMLTHDPIYTGASAAVAIIILVILLAAKSVIQTGWHVGFRILVMVVFLYDLVTSYYGNQSFIIRSEDTTVEQFFILIGLTLFVSGATIAIPYAKESEAAVRN